MSNPNGIRAESAWTPVASIDTRYATPRDSTVWVEEASIELAVGVEAALQEWMLEDLDLLDETARHCRCTYCQPGSVKALDVFIAICGKRVLAPGGEGLGVPAGACEDCLHLYRQPCSKCGY